MLVVSFSPSRFARARDPIFVTANIPITASGQSGHPGAGRVSRQGTGSRSGLFGAQGGGDPALPPAHIRRTYAPAPSHRAPPAGEACSRAGGGRVSGLIHSRGAQTGTGGRPRGQIQTADARVPAILGRSGSPAAQRDVHSPPSLAARPRRCADASPSDDSSETNSPPRKNPHTHTHRLTVRAGKANTHESYGWQEFTDAVIK